MLSPCVEVQAVPVQTPAHVPSTERPSDHLRRQPGMIYDPETRRGYLIDDPVYLATTFQRRHDGYAYDPDIDVWSRGGEPVSHARLKAELVRHIIAELDRDARAKASGKNKVVNFPLGYWFVSANPGWNLTRLFLPGS